VPISVFFVFTEIVQDLPGKKWLTGLFAWVITVLFLALMICGFTSLVFGWPPSLARLLGATPSLKTSPVEADSTDTLPQILPTPTASPLSRYAPQLIHDQRMVPPGIKQPVTIEPQPDLYFISGMVRDVTKRDSLDAGRGTVPSAAITIINKKTGEKYETSTDNWGSFSQRVPVGRYSVTATHRDYIPETAAYEVKKSDDYDMLSIEMKLKPEVAESRFEQSLGLVWITVSEETDRRIPNVLVTVRSKTSSSLIPLENRTGSDGHCEFQDLNHGSYVVTLTHDKFQRRILECTTNKGSGCMLQLTMQRITQ
jgi:hypothetical protein